MNFDLRVFVATIKAKKVLAFIPKDVLDCSTINFS